MQFDEHSDLDNSVYKKASIANVKRLAKWLRLRIVDMSEGQIRRLVRWRVSSHRKYFG